MIEINPATPEAHLKLADSLFELGKFDEAIKHYRIAIGHKPGLVAAHVALGNAFSAAGRPNEALKSFLDAAALNPGNAGIHFNIGNAYAVLEQFESAIERFSEALRLQPAFESARVNLGIALKYSGHFEAAIETLTRVNVPESRSMILECLLRLKRYDDFFAMVERDKGLDEVNLHSAAISAYAAQQLERDDPHPFCPDAFKYIRVIDNPGGIDDSKGLLDELVRAAKALPTVYEPQHVSTIKGFQTVGINLFENATGPFAILEGIIKAEIDRYYAEVRLESTAFARKWPRKASLSAWYVELLAGGYQGAHIHPGGWLSGVIYLRTPAEAEGSAAGRIEFLLKGDSYPTIVDEGPGKVFEPRPGRLMLFPSSLHHRTIPFKSSDERLCIAFDLRPHY